MVRLDALRWVGALGALAAVLLAPGQAVPVGAFSLTGESDPPSPMSSSGWRFARECELQELAARDAAAEVCGGLALDWTPADDPSPGSTPNAVDPPDHRSADIEATEAWPNLPLASLATGLALVASAVPAFANGPHEPFHFTREGFFGRNTYAGGADKAAHFVNTGLLSKELTLLYTRLGYSEVKSRWMGFGVASVGGLLTEVGDGTTKYGFSYEDLLMDVLGAGSAALISAAGIDDLIGFRYGFLLPPEEDTCCPVKGLGHDYSNEIYTADLKINGVARRLGLPVGPLKYLFVSVTYGSKGYPSGFPSERQRLVGFDLGLNLAEIMNDIGVRRDTWWGYMIHMVVDNVRFPYTAGGFRYDLNSGEWHGPTTR